jgi:SAM-dependent methyltransferase
MTTPLANSPAAQRNRQPILEVLQQVLPARGTVLEIASGTGQHAAWFGAAMRDWIWQPSDADPQALPAIEGWTHAAGLTNVRAPVWLDVMAPHWPSDSAAFTEPFDAVYCANMLHISPWATCAALMRGAAHHLAQDGVLVTYGPYLEDEVATAPGNLAFDASLRERDPQWGIRRVEDVAAQANKVGLRLQARHQMPANNLLLVFGRGQ